MEVYLDRRVARKALQQQQLTGHKPAIVTITEANVLVLDLAEEDITLAVEVWQPIWVLGQ